MAHTSLLSLSLCFLVILHGCYAQLEQQQWQNLQQHRLRTKTECRIEKLTAQEPTSRFESEAGVTEVWDPNNEQFECAGVKVTRNVVQPKGLVLPYYANAPQLAYIVQGKGILGTVFPGCAETFESESQASAGEPRQRFVDRHQKTHRFQSGDVLALETGVANWIYNDGEVPIVSLSVIDTSNDANQLDQNSRDFILAGNVYRGQQQVSSNIFNGFDEQILADVFNVEKEMVRKLKGQGDQRGRIVRAENLEVVSPETEEQRQGGRPNGLEETICTARLVQNIGSPSRADVFNPRGGRVTSLNSQKLPILNSLQLSAERGVLYKNALMAPHWNMNAHSIMYVIRGSGRLQVIGNSGRSVFDDVVREGQLIIIPQNFVVVKKAGNQGLEWIAFKTNDNAMTSPLAGRLSAVRGMPEEVLMNSYEISREEARNLKYNRQELTMFGPGSRPPRVST